jgi:hypothetical protein
MTIRRAFLLFLLLLAAVAVALWRGWLDVPPQWNPWAPLDVRQPPNLLTPLKMLRLQHDRELCALALQTSTLRYVAVADRAPDNDCPLRNVVRVQSAQPAYSSPFLATCPLATALALFERNGLQPAAQQVFGQPVTQIEHFGSFACRNIGNSTRRSQHASANALDIAGFRLADGRRITLSRHWKGVGDEARFLRLVREAACQSFNTTLGPEYNAAHHDHLHVDMGMFRMCR